MLATLTLALALAGSPTDSSVSAAPWTNDSTWEQHIERVFQGATDMLDIDWQIERWHHMYQQALDPIDPLYYVPDNEDWDWA